MAAESEILNRLDRIEAMLTIIVEHGGCMPPPVTAVTVAPEERSEVVNVEIIKRLARLTAKHGKKVVHEFNAQR